MRWIWFYFWQCQLDIKRILTFKQNAEWTERESCLYLKFLRVLINLWKLEPKSVPETFRQSEMNDAADLWSKCVVVSHH